MEKILTKIRDFDNYISYSSTSDIIRKKSAPYRDFSMEKILRMVINENPEDKEYISNIYEILIDLRLQQFYLEDSTATFAARVLDIGIMNLKENPSQVFVYMNINQMIIIQSRIFFEKVMDFIHYLVTKQYIEKSDGNKKDFFFKNKLKKDENFKQWKFMLKWKPLVKAFDDLWRNNEVHGRSVLAKFMYHKNVDQSLISFSNQILTFQNNIITSFWAYTNRILSGSIITDEELLNIEEQVNKACLFMRIIINEK